LCAILDLLPDAFGLGVDLSPAACKVARANLDRNGLGKRSTVICGDWTEALAGHFDLIVSNPPYVGLDEKAALAPEVADQDPDLALFGGADGLDCYRQIARHLGPLLASGGGAFFEIGWRQADSVIDILGAEGFANAQITKDAGGRDRVVGVSKP
jgi:release factor glutamine methyltransferase